MSISDHADHGESSGGHDGSTDADRPVEEMRLNPRIGYMTAEFPGQTHVWQWREIVHLREWGSSINIFSTRRPSVRDRAATLLHPLRRPRRSICGR